MKSDQGKTERGPLLQWESSKQAECKEQEDSLYHKTLERKRKPSTLNCRSRQRRDLPVKEKSRQRPPIGLYGDLGQRPEQIMFARRSPGTAELGVAPCFKGKGGEGGLPFPLWDQLERGKLIRGVPARGDHGEFDPGQESGRASATMSYLAPCDFKQHCHRRHCYIRKKKRRSSTKKKRGSNP